MKNKKIIMSLVTTMLLFSSLNSVNAKGVNPVDDAKRVETFLAQASPELKELYEEQPFMLGEEWFDENGDLVPIVKQNVKYVEISTYIDSNDSNEDIVTEKQLTAEEYANWEPMQTRASCEYYGAADCWETTAKRIILVYQTAPSEKAMVLNQWKAMPSVRSYDTIGLLYNNFTMTSAFGRQWYNIQSDSSTKRYIDYSYGGNEMKISTTGQKGVSVSQDIVDNAYAFLQNDLYVYGSQGTNMQMASSYQHAVKNIDLATSKNFTFNAWGMGKVFKWNVPTSNWDNMQGVCLNWSPYLWTC